MQEFYDREAARKAWSPVYRFDNLGSGYFRDLAVEDFTLAFDEGELVAMAACWDQSRFKQTRVHGYSGAMRYLRPAYNVVAALLPSHVPLPREGTNIRSAYATALHCRGNNANDFRALLASLIRNGRLREADYLMVGLDAHSPLCEALDAFSHRLVRGGHYLVGFGDEPPPVPGGEFYFECARI